jgi:hypothetical protein
MLSARDEAHKVNTPCENRLYCATHIVCIATNQRNQLIN